MSLEESDKMQSTLYLGLARENFPRRYFLGHFPTKSLLLFDTTQDMPLFFSFFFCVSCRRNYSLLVCVCGFSVCAHSSKFFHFFCHYVIVSHGFLLCGRGSITAVYVYALLYCQFLLL